MALRAALRLASLALTALAVVSLAGCADKAGPLQTLSAGGHPVIDGGGSPVLPGQPADFTAFIVNPLRTPVTAVSAAIVPVPGVPAGHLAHVALTTTNGFIGGGRGWPPSVPIRTFKGAKIQPGQTGIVIGITGQVAGRDYFAAGLKVGYLYKGSLHYVIAWSVGEACVRSTPRAHHPECVAALNHAVAKVKRLAS